MVFRTLTQAGPLQARTVRRRRRASGPNNRAGEPQAVDLRPVFKKWSLDPRAQGIRTTCSVFTITEAIEYALASRQDRATRLSVEFLNWAAHKETQNPDDGGFFSEMWKGFAAHGVCPEKDLPYLDHYDRILQPGKSALAAARSIRDLGLQIHWIKDWNPNRGLSEKQLAEVKKTLRLGWPVCGGFLWPKQADWDDDVLRICPRDQVRDGHSVLLVGFRDDPKQPGGGVVLIRNSSGKSRDGMLTYEYLRTYMNDAVWIDGGDRSADASFAPGAISDERNSGGLARYSLSRSVGRLGRSAGRPQPPHLQQRTARMGQRQHGHDLAPAGREDRNAPAGRTGRDNAHLVHQPCRRGERAERAEHPHLLGRAQGAGRRGPAGRFLCRRPGQAGGSR